MPKKAVSEPQTSAERLATVQDDVANARKQFRLKEGSGTQVMVVSKKKSVAEIRPLLEAGHRCFGENKVQEAAEKWAELLKEYPDIELHLIGPLQSNKVKEALVLFDAIHTIDREKLVDAIAKHRDDASRTKRFYVQVNTGEEEQKSGVFPQEADDLIRYCDEKGIALDGLMCIPPLDDVAAMHFAFLRVLAARHGLKRLSMGMSGDYVIAAALGSSIVRVGSAILGEREAA